MRSIITLLLLLIAGFGLNAQVRILNDASVIDPTSNKSAKVAKPATITDNQSLVFPSAVGTVGQVLTITAKSGNTLTLGWSTESVSTVTASDRISTADQSDGSGLSVTVKANHKYSYTGLIRGNRENSGGTPSDNFILSIAGPSGSTKVTINARCYDCTTFDGDDFKKDGDAYVATAVINPPDYNTYSFFVEGMIITGANAGNLVVKMEQSTGANNVILKEHSYIVVTELE
jgi:hypothetical protein